MRLGADRVRVVVPATSANLGPGFDSLGMALNYHDELVVEALGSDRVEVAVHGQGAGQVPTDGTHLVARAIHRALEHVGAPLVGLRLTCDNHIPHGRGMGSSAAAVVAGLFAARGLIAEPEALDDHTILQLATEFEGHPDNAAPAIYGGATVAWMEESLPHAVRLALHPDVTPTVIVPTVSLSTNRARGVLPPAVKHASAAFNAGRTALLVHALAQAPDLLFAATEDKLHQDFRSEVMPDSYALMKQLRSKGLAATISGAGPTVLVLDRATHGDRVRNVVTDLLGQNALEAVNPAWQVWETGVDAEGAVVTAV
ncbi:homoserine kinase [Jonesiaceae bacterium BS-20]|uniref:Homoserine kinase n=1 Tax=Jonesiaceae bacterium BS-20 TaxID=3120821 RepID=A0AAU7DV64_9MICO